MIALVLGATQLAACGRLAPSIPAAPPVTTAAAPAASVSPAVRTPAQLGVQIFWHDVKPEQLRENAGRLLDYVAGLGANSVGLTFPIYTDGPKPTRVYIKPGNTPTPADIAALTAAARERGLRVLVRPLFDEVNLRPAKVWRGSIKPSDPDNWFKSYSTVLAPYLTAAQTAHADGFVMGSELDSMTTHPAQWRTAMAAAGTLFRGRLMYADNWGAWIAGRGGVPGADPGVDAYPRFDLPDTASVAQLTDAWTNWLRTRRDGRLGETVIQEVGITATPGAYAKSNAWPEPGQKLVPQIQANWFAGACAAARSLGMAGIYFWTLGEPGRRHRVRRRLLHRPWRSGDQGVLRVRMAGPVSTTERHLSLTQEIRIRNVQRLRRVEDRRTRRRADPAMIGVGLAATVLAVAACVYFYRAGRILGYHDTYSHLEISRRLLVGRTTGIAQLGAIWLPLPHLLQALFAWNTWLYTTGLAGSIVSMTAYVASSVLIYRMVRVYSPGRAAPAVAGAAVFMLGANVLHHQSTSMDELPFYAFALAATYGLMRWADSRQPTYLLHAAMASMLAMLCRYEGWFLAGVFTLAVPVIARRLGHSWPDTRGLTGMFAAFGLFTSAAGWMLYNWMIAGSPLNFLTGPNSSADQMSRRTTDVETGDLGRTLHAYAGALVADHGFVVLGLAVAGLVAFLLGERLSARSLPVFALGSVMPFFLYTIYRGQAPIGMPPVNEYVLNARFGLIAALPAAVLAGYLIARLPGRTALAASILVIAALGGLTTVTFRQDALVSVREVTDDLSSQQDQVRVAAFLAGHTSGPIMLDLVGNERAAFPVLDRVIYDGTKVGRRNVWREALTSPRSVGAEVVLMRGSGARGRDAVYNALHDASAMQGYRAVYEADGYTVYQLS
ncbi:hypothetical protein ACWT_8228 [Actinoplanes sp. SE50]|uniref:glycoside hydrolase family 113 n=1 Tax=unclassified Actinoplanes TaxID=2626549 RepID=UPI00023EDDEC|nr:MULTISPECIES: glycosyltransferase family 39 protein [unclassified Actinoplanes]AEV89237.1 hypothetical protein ACPL_8361 [Actinoplanes sp. SE50/110]ATO87643.1 hypothetical protein ACWT_8228 [Actinoplanes sp. SE50]SLM05062.1 hypothetical protein ACSP50_8378 [Actinoplanes sp. SE50/110]